MTCGKVFYVGSAVIMFFIIRAQPAEWHFAQEVSGILIAICILAIHDKRCLLLARGPPFSFSFGPPRGKVWAPLHYAIRAQSNNIWNDLNYKVDTVDHRTPQLLYCTNLIKLSVFRGIEKLSDSVKSLEVDVWMSSFLGRTLPWRTYHHSPYNSYSCYCFNYSRQYGLVSLVVNLKLQFLNPWVGCVHLFQHTQNNRPTWEKLL